MGAFTFKLIFIIIVIMSKSTIRIQLATIDLFAHGKEVFGDEEKFLMWLQSENFYFNNKRPIEWLLTLEGIKHLDDRLTGMEYGDNA